MNFATHIDFLIFGNGSVGNDVFMSYSYNSISYTLKEMYDDGTIANLRPTPAGGAWEDDQWLDFSDPATLAAWEERHGYTLVVETPQPQDTDTVKHDESVVLVDGVPTQTWTARPWNAAEVAERAAAANAVTLQADTAAYLTKLKEAIDALAVLLAADTTAGSIRHNASVMVCTSSSRRFSISPVCSCSLPDQQLSIKCTKSLRCNSFRNAISMRLVRQLRAADNTNCSTRQPTIHPIYMARLSPDTPVAISIKCLQTNTKNKEAPTCNIPVKAYTIIGIRKPQEIFQSHFIHFPILIQTKILSFFHSPVPSHPPSAHK